MDWIGLDLGKAGVLVELQRQWASGQKKMCWKPGGTSAGNSDWSEEQGRLNWGWSVVTGHWSLGTTGDCESESEDLSSDRSSLDESGRPRWA